MRARTVMISLVCAAGLVLSGCAGSISGSPQLPGAGAAGAGSSDPQNPPAGQPGGQSGSPTLPTPDSQGSDSGDGGDTGLPQGSSDEPPLPTGGLPTGGLPTGGIPGLSSECLAVAGIAMAVGLLFVAPMMGGQALTKEQVDQAFSGLGEVPPELKQPVQVLHDAAVQAIGKPAAQAVDIVGSPQVSQALDALSKYTDAKCGGS